MDVLNTLTVKEFNSLCRFCTKKQKNLKPIFKEENDGGCFDFTNSCGDNGIVNMLNECTGLEVMFKSFICYVDAIVLRIFLCLSDEVISTN